MNEAVKIVECPRDAWQGLPVAIPAEIKAQYLRSLIAAGFTHIDAVSFVSPVAVPQMADSERVLELLQPPRDVEIIGIVVNRKGAERAIATGAVTTLGFPYSVSAEFLRRNQHQTQEESLRILGEIVKLAAAATLDVVAYISMAFGNPYGESFSAQGLADAYARLIDAGVRQISLADTVGLAPPAWIASIFGRIAAEFPDVEIGVHLHSRRDDAAARIQAAYAVGCRRFDSALGGLGGCPFAQDELVANIPTEILLQVLAECGAQLPRLAPIDDLIHAGTEIARAHSGAAHQP